jgi:glycosyltransferase involved in cell wall biosynthesis
MSQGVPVVASRVGGLPEVVADGRTGLIVPPRDARALAEALRRLRGDAAFRAALGAAGRVRVEEDFHVGRSIAAFEALFRRLSAVPGRT